MPYSFVQAGTTLQRVDASGTANAMTLPDDLILNQRRARFAILDRRVCMVNSPSHNVMMLQGDPIKKADDTVVSMSPVAPKGIPPYTLAARDPISEETGLTGTYKYKISFLIKEPNRESDRVVAESPLGEVEGSITLDNQVVDITNIPIAEEPSITDRRLYRTLDGGEVYFHVQDVDGNSITTATDDSSDESIALAPAPDSLGNPPGSYGSASRLELVTAWKGRLFGRTGGATAKPTAVDKDVLLWSEARQPYAWPVTNSLPIPPVGGDSFGITAFLPRRDKLGIGKRDALYAITSPTPLEGQLRRIASIGVVAPESVVIKDDTAWFLSEDGIYVWGSDDTVRNLTVENVHPWFNTDTYFNRAAFEDVVGFYHDGRESIIWLMPEAESSVLNRWIEYYPAENIWLGPHSTGEFTPTYVSAFEDQDSVESVVFGGSDGRIYEENAQGFDGAVQGSLNQSDTEGQRRTLIFDGSIDDGDGFRMVDIDIPTTLDADIVITPEDSVALITPQFPWSLLQDVTDASIGDEPTPSTSIALAASLFDEKVNILIGKTATNKLLIAATEPIFPLNILIYTINPGLEPSTIIDRATGIEMIIETQPQTASEPEMFKHWGELSLEADVEAGHELLVTSTLDGTGLKHESPEEIIDRVRLNRVGDGNRMSLRIMESSTAPTCIYGYYISPLNMVGRR